MWHFIRVSVQWEISYTLPLEILGHRNVEIEALIPSRPFSAYLHQNLTLILSQVGCTWFPSFLKGQCTVHTEQFISRHQQTCLLTVEFHNTQPSLSPIISMEMPIKIKGMETIFHAVFTHEKHHVVKIIRATNNMWWHKCPHCKAEGFSDHTLVTATVCVLREHLSGWH